MGIKKQQHDYLNNKQRAINFIALKIEALSGKIIQGQLRWTCVPYSKIKANEKGKRKKENPEKSGKTE